VPKEAFYCSLAVSSVASARILSFSVFLDWSVCICDERVWIEFDSFKTIEKTSGRADSLEKSTRLFNYISFNEIPLTGVPLIIKQMGNLVSPGISFDSKLYMHISGDTVTRRTRSYEIGD
jgi:hypothetical protein